jgi:hypothetical protein
MYKNSMCQVSVVFYSRAIAFDFGSAKRRRAAFYLYWDLNVFALPFEIKYLVTRIKKYYDSRKLFHNICPD